jgi:hypothetical protein
MEKETYITADELHADTELEDRVRHLFEDIVERAVYFKEINAELFRERKNREITFHETVIVCEATDLEVLSDQVADFYHDIRRTMKVLNAAKGPVSEETMEKFGLEDYQLVITDVEYEPKLDLAEHREYDLGDGGRVTDWYRGYLGIVFAFTLENIAAFAPHGYKYNESMYRLFCQTPGSNVNRLREFAESLGIAVDPTASREELCAAIEQALK